MDRRVQAERHQAARRTSSSRSGSLFPINVIEEVARPVTLAARLFFNIFVGELLFFIVASIIAAHVTIGPFNLSLGATVVPFFIQFFNFFVGTVQAFVFTLLAIVYLSLAIGGRPLTP